MMAQERIQADINWMTKALALAKKAETAGEVPVGAVLIKNEVVVGEGFNAAITRCDPTAHAEIMALRDAATTMNNYRLPETTLYVTLEPCTMCIGAIIHARVSRLVYAATEPRAGAVESQIKLLELPHYNHTLEVVGGVLAEPCSAILRNFFHLKRKQPSTITTKIRNDNH